MMMLESIYNIGVSIYNNPLFNDHFKILIYLIYLYNNIQEVVIKKIFLIKMIYIYYFYSIFWYHTSIILNQYKNVYEIGFFCCLLLL